MKKSNTKREINCSNRVKTAEVEYAKKKSPRYQSYERISLDKELLLNEKPPINSYSSIICLRLNVSQAYT